MSGVRCQFEDDLDCNNLFSAAYTDAGGTWTENRGESKVKSDDAGMHTQLNSV